MDKRDPIPMEKLRTDALEIALGAIRACDPEKLVTNAIKKDSEAGRADPTFVLSLGKAALSMMRGAFAAGVRARGIAVGPAEHFEELEVPDGWTCLPADHPLPTARCVEAGQIAEQACARLGKQDTLLVLLSGGASAHLCTPIGDLTLSDLREMTDLLLRSGAPITDVNRVRVQLDRLKGGGLAQVASPAAVRTLVLCDVLDADGEPVLGAVSSGPTVRQDAGDIEILSLVDRWLGDRCPRAVREHLEAIPVPPGAMRSRESFERCEIRSLGDARGLGDAGAAIARDLGYGVRRGMPLRGEVSDSAVAVLREAMGADPATATVTVCVGETTVTVGDAAGMGGRNQEFALTAAREIRGQRRVVVAVGSDGVDGPTDAAGGIVDGATWDRISATGMDPDGSLAMHDSYRALDASGDLIRTGPTGTNVNDLVLVLDAGMEHSA